MVQTAAARLDSEPTAAEERRREILAAASRLFRERGLHGTGMRDIAAALGCTAGNLYYYFESKQELLAYCQEATLGELAAEAELQSRAGGAVAPRLRALVAAHVVSLNESRPGSLAHLEVEALPARRRRALLERRKSYEHAVAALVAEGQRRGELRSETDPELAALAILGAVNWTVKWFDPSGRKTAREVGEAFADLLIGGLLAGGESVR
jgi:AcrR family transcriptional regulator